MSDLKKMSYLELKRELKITKYLYRQQKRYNSTHWIDRENLEELIDLKSKIRYIKQLLKGDYDERNLR